MKHVEAPYPKRTTTSLFGDEIFELKLLSKMAGQPVPHVKRKEARRLVLALRDTLADRPVSTQPRKTTEAIKVRPRRPRLKSQAEWKREFLERDRLRMERLKNAA